MLETVDLEFERVLSERDDYAATLTSAEEEAVLDTDLLRSVLDEALPADYQRDFKASSELLDEMLHFEVRTVADLRTIITRHLEKAQEEEKEFAIELLSAKMAFLSKEMRANAERGRIFNCIGLARGILRLDVGEEQWKAYHNTERGT